MTRQKTAAAGQREGRETKEAYFGFPAFCMKGVIRYCVIHAAHSGEWGSDTALFTGEQKAGFLVIFFIYV